MKTTINGHAGFATQLLNPSAWIVKNNRKDNSLSNDRGRVKIYPNNTVYLDNGNFFEIEIYNPLKVSVLSIIKVQDTLISKSGLVLRPGERVYLDCFIDSKKKFQYNTYQVESTQENKEAISLNGLIDISFYKEEIVYTQDYPTFDWADAGRQYHQNNQGIFSKSTGTVNLSNYSHLTTTQSLSTTTSNNLTLIGSITNTSAVPAPIDTGRIESGEASNTKFTEVFTKFESARLGGIKYQILPLSSKPFSSDDIQVKNYCPGCGKNIKAHVGDNFCSGCGKKLK